MRHDSIPAGDLAVVNLEISYLGDGTGPLVATDSHFGTGVKASLRTAADAAAKAVGYDPRFLRVQLSITTSFLQRRLHIDGSSAGAVMAVGIMSALLGDSIRPEVCMSGIINASLEVEAVGGLEEKIKGCRQFKYRVMIVPAGQISLELALKGREYDMTLIEVRTLAEAYQAATSQPIRPALQ